MKNAPSQLFNRLLPDVLSLDVDRKGAGLQPIDRTKVLSTEELGHLLSVARVEFPEFYPLILLLADTGCRIGEALALRWSDVDLVTGIVRIERSVDHAGRLGLTKTRRGRVVELSTRLREVFASSMLCLSLSCVPW